MKTKNKLLKAIAIIALLLGSNELIAQTNTSSTQTVCAGSLAEPYLIPATVQNSTSTFNWIISSGGTITSGQGTNQIAVDWSVIPGGPHTITVTESDLNGCIGAPVTVDVTINTLDDATFALTDYCEGSANSATLTGTAGGVFTFTAPVPTGGETINSVTGEITGGIAGTTYSVTYTTTGICPQSSVQTLTIYATPTTGPINHW